MDRSTIHVDLFCKLHKLILYLLYPVLVHNLVGQCLVSIVGSHHVVLEYANRTGSKLHGLGLIISHVHEPKDQAIEEVVYSYDWFQHSHACR